MEKKIYTHERQERAYRTTGKPLCERLPDLAGDEASAHKLAVYLEGRRLDYALAIRNGWYASRTAGDLWLRCVVPSLSADPANKFWQARLIDTDAPTTAHRWQSPHGKARGDAFTVVWPIEGAKRVQRAVVVEGPTDALASAMVPRTMGIALQGVTPPREVLDFMSVFLHGMRRRLPELDVLCVPDADQPKAMARVQMTLRCKAEILPPPAAKDVAELSLENRVRYLSGGALDGTPIGEAANCYEQPRAWCSVRV